ncbi:MAG: helix-turn-helix domain-containing protein [Eubacteriales bacterium]|nr:helix-turn-helix domain-containing protein [Eubacteriales bacterium]
MYANSGYLHNTLADFEDHTRPLIVLSSGTYHLRTRQILNTFRPIGRKDYQLLYLASGKAHFFFRGQEEVLTAGHMILYRPGEPQRYTYYAKDQTVVYWVHFTGSDVESILAHYGLPLTAHTFYSGTNPEYQQLFRQIIRELQICKPCFEELLSILLRQIFLQVQRQLLEAPRANDKIQQEMETAAHYFNENFSAPISVEAYASALHMSTCWFIRSFKQFTGMTPMQYITSIRIANAQNLLETSDYNINEIAAIVGYENALYFSRIFKKHTGSSPSEYRKESRPSSL